MSGIGSLLLVVDVQKDFLPGGALPVPRGDEVVPVVNAIMPLFDFVIGTQDWHPADHVSFAASHSGRRIGERIEVGGTEQVLWPVHCVAGTSGADFAPGLETVRFDVIVRKGTRRDTDSYSAFFDNARRRSTGLAGLLEGLGLRRIHVCGLATDYCVLYTVLDALSCGFEAVLVEDACRGVDAEPGDVERAVERMKRAGASVVSAATLESELR